MSNDLIAQPHGGALKPPFPPRTSGNVSGWRKTKREALALLKEATPEASARLLALARSDDERVAAVAVTQILDRTIGKATDEPQGEDASARTVDLSALTMDERDELLAALATVRRLRHLAGSRAGGGVIDGAAE